MGTQLSIDQHMMSIIEKDHPNDCTKCCFEMFYKWLCNNPDACWEDITTAVDRLLAAGMYLVMGISLITCVYIHN